MPLLFSLFSGLLFGLGLKKCLVLGLVREIGCRLLLGQIAKEVLLFALGQFRRRLDVAFCRFFGGSFRLKRRRKLRLGL